jgi:hypothetical protein
MDRTPLSCLCNASVSSHVTFLFLEDFWGLFFRGSVACTAKRTTNASFGMDHKLGINVVRDLPNDDQGRCYDFLGVEGWEGAEEFGGAIIEVRSI